MALSLELLEPLPALVKARYDSAEACNALTLSFTHLAIVEVNGIRFQLRYCPALSMKPTGDHSAIRKLYHGNEPEKHKKPDPFENPSPDLLIAQVPRSNATHNLILNKYPVIAQHFILATQEYRAQTHFLDQDDLNISYACLKAWERGAPNKRLFAFFNSGLHSGSSQSHRHIQFLPVEEMRGNDSTLWEPLIDSVYEDGIKAGERITHPLPFAYQSIELPDGLETEDLLRYYQILYAAARNIVFSSSPELERPTEDVLHSQDPSKQASISYNLAMTTKRMMICPRRSETAMVAGPPTGPNSQTKANQIGPVAVNGTILAGTLMVKTEEEWHALRGALGPKRLEAILGEVGFPVSEGRGNNKI